MYGAVSERWGSCFHFEDLWTEYEECDTIMNQIWAGGDTFNRSLALCRRQLTDWSKKKFWGKTTILKNQKSKLTMLKSLPPSENNES